MRIEDFPNAIDNKGNAFLRRAYTLTAEGPIEKLYLRAAVGAKIEAAGNGWYRVNGWRMRVESDALPEIRSAGNQMELLVPIRFQGKTAKIVQEYHW